MLGLSKTTDLNREKLKAEMLEKAIEKIIKDCWRAQHSVAMEFEIVGIRQYAQRVLCDVKAIP